mmetsp:Transcript_38144/g.89448  ORF Transcript_38144/g.89448 Transcript_38144/m.89448 type:complete len:922 (+) Transcript_38144:75-2840(+)
MSSTAIASPVVGLSPPSLDRQPSITARPADSLGRQVSDYVCASSSSSCAAASGNAAPSGGRLAGSVQEPAMAASALPTLTSLPSSRQGSGAVRQAPIIATTGDSLRVPSGSTAVTSRELWSGLQMVPAATVSPVTSVRLMPSSSEEYLQRGRIVPTSEASIGRPMTPTASETVITVAGPPAATVFADSYATSEPARGQVMPYRHQAKSSGVPVSSSASSMQVSGHEDLHPVLSGRPISSSPTSTVKVSGVTNQCPACGNTFKPDAIFCRKCGRKRTDVSKEQSPVAHDERKEARVSQASAADRFRHAARDAGRAATSVKAMQPTLQPAKEEDPAAKALRSEVHDVTMQALREYHQRHSDPEEHAARQRAKSQPPSDNLPHVQHQDHNGLRVQTGGGKENNRSFALPEPLPPPTGVGHEAVALLRPPESEVWDPSTAGMEREVAAREMELKALRTEVASKEEEAQALRQQVDDASMKLLTAAGVVDTMSVKVETTAGNQHAILEASARQIDAQVNTLRRRLAHMEWELAEKDDEIQVLQEAAGVDAMRMAQQQGELGRLAHNQAVQGMQLQQLSKDAYKLHRHIAVNDWKEQVQAKIEQENADSFVQRERRGRESELQKVDMENRQLLDFIKRMEAKCRQHTSELHAHEGHMLELLMEERMAIAAAQLGHQAAEQEKRNHYKEHSQLEARIQKELQRSGTRSGQGNAYDQYEVNAKGMELELQLLTECMRHIGQVLREPGGAGDAIDNAMAEFLKASRELGEPLPPVARASANEYLIGHELVRCALMEGQLLVQPQGGGLVPIGDFMISRVARPGPQPVGGPSRSGYGQSPPPGSRGLRSGSPARTGYGVQVPQQGLTVNSLQSHAALQVMRASAAAPASSPHHPGLRAGPQAVPGQPGRPYGMPALVQPMTIGGAEPFVNV